MIEVPQVFTWKVKELGIPESEFVEAGKTGYEQVIYIAFSKAGPNSAKYADMLSKGIQELRKSGELAKILTKYGVTDWKKYISQY